MNRITPATLSFIVALSACGGSSGGASTPATAQAPISQTASVSTSAAPLDPTCGLANFQQEMLDRVNLARASSRMCGTTYHPAVGPLMWNSKLTDAGAAHAADMGNKNYFQHNSLDGRVFSDRITDAGYTWREAGENIAAGQTSFDQVMNDWLKSPGHCSNIMNGIFTEVGMSCVKNENSTYKWYWAMELGLPK